MKDFFDNRHDNSFALVADRWNLKNLSNNWNCLFRSLSKEGFINSHHSCVRLLADPHTICFNSFLSNGKLLRYQSKPRVVS
jgi:hypothetical protein